MPSTLGTLLATLRKQRRLSRMALADAADVSATYIVQIEDGVDPRSGKPVQPSPTTLRKLADGLAGADPSAAQALYADLMAAVGYAVAVPAVLSPPPKADAPTGPTVTLTDPRLQTHCRVVLERWAMLGSREQTAVLAMMELVAASLPTAPARPNDDTAASR